MKYLSESDYVHGQAPATGVLLANLGTPDAPDRAAVRRYLKQFLWDPRVVETPRPLWWLILNGIILNLRPKQSAAKYASVWLPEGSPLRVQPPWKVSRDLSRLPQYISAGLGPRMKRSPVSMEPSGFGGSGRPSSPRSSIS